MQTARQHWHRDEYEWGWRTGHRLTLPAVACATAIDIECGVFDGRNMNNVLNCAGSDNVFSASIGCTGCARLI